MGTLRSTTQLDHFREATKMVIYIDSLRIASMQSCRLLIRAVC